MNYQWVESSFVIIDLEQLVNCSEVGETIAELINELDLLGECAEAIGNVIYIDYFEREFPLICKHLLDFSNAKSDRIILV